MKIHKLIVVGMFVAGLVMVSVVDPAQAQLSSLKKGLSVGGKSEQATPAADIDKMRADLDRSISEVGSARKLLFEAQIELAAALGVKEEADKILSAANVLQSGSVVTQTDVVQIESSQEPSNDLNALLSDASASAGPLDEQGRQHFAKGQAAFAKGLVAEAGQIAVITALAAEIKKQSGKMKSNPANAAKLAAMAVPAAKLATLIPGDVEAGIGTYQLIKKVGADNNIAVEKIDEDKLLLGAQ